MSKSKRDKIVYFVRNQKVIDKNVSNYSGYTHFIEKEMDLVKNGRKKYGYDEMPTDVKKQLRLTNMVLNPVAPNGYEIPSRGHPLRKQNALLKKVHRRNERAKNNQQVINQMKKGDW